MLLFQDQKEDVLRKIRVGKENDTSVAASSSQQQLTACDLL
jgi:hypothetical protein